MNTKLWHISRKLWQIFRKSDKCFDCDKICLVYVNGLVRKGICLWIQNCNKFLEINDKFLEKYDKFLQNCKKFLQIRDKFLQTCLSIVNGLIRKGLMTPNCFLFLESCDKFLKHFYKFLYNCNKFLQFNERIPDLNMKYRGFIFELWMTWNWSYSTCFIIILTELFYFFPIRFFLTNYNIFILQGK